MISKSDDKGLRHPPFAFTEQGVAMLSSVLNSKRAIEINILIMRAFVKLRELISTHKGVETKLKDLEDKLSKQDKQMKQTFNKKIFTFGLLAKDIGFLFYEFFSIISAMRNKQITKAFMEKIMVVVTAVNGCTYCHWFHAKQAVASGISEDEVKNMFNLQFQADASDFEIIALLYAQHYAETNRNLDK